VSVNINGADMPTLTVYKRELQRISDLRLNISPEITDYMKSRINDIESYNDETLSPQV
jgi:chloramphenicol O-acetyltransferase